MSYSKDLRVRVIRAVENGETARGAARHFVIGDSTAIRWAKRWRETGSVEARSVKGQSRSPLKKHEEWLLDLVRRGTDLTLGGKPVFPVCGGEEKKGRGLVVRGFWQRRSRVLKEG